MKTIQITVSDSTERISFEKLTPFQGDAKELTGENLDKLKKRILSVGFSAPVLVWENDQTIFILDGHQRTTALRSLKADGYHIPEIPIVRIEAPDERTARELTLSYISQYGEINKESDWLKEAFEEMDSAIKESFVFRDGEIDFDLNIDFGDLPEEQPPEQPKKEQCCPSCGHVW